MKILLKALAVCLLLTFPAGAKTLSCLDEDGKPVDWWIVLKLDDGFRYLYRDANSQGRWFDMPKDGLDAPDGHHALALTLNALYTSTPNHPVGYLIYNDQALSKPKENSKAARAHAKGVVAFDHSQGFWLIHSIPQFPNAVSSGTYTGLPSNSRAFGQSFLCATYPLEEFSEIAAQLYIDNPNVTQGSAPEDLAELIGDQLIHLLSRTVKPIDLGLPQSSVGILHTREGHAITSFAKSARWRLDLYEDLIAPYFKSDLLVRTWMRAPGNLPTFCAPEFGYSVMLVHNLELPDKSIFSRKNDHSKWAISAPHSHRPLVCIGDINTQTTQRSRGGGASCIEDENTWAAFNDLVHHYDQCRSN